MQEKILSTILIGESADFGPEYRRTKRIKGRARDIVVPSTGHIRFSRCTDPFYKCVSTKPDIPPNVSTHTTHNKWTYTKRVPTHIREYTKMGNITRYLDVARVHASQPRPCHQESVASRIPIESRPDKPVFTLDFRRKFQETRRASGPLWPLPSRIYHRREARTRCTRETRER